MACQAYLSSPCLCTRRSTRKIQLIIRVSDDYNNSHTNFVTRRRNGDLVVSFISSVIYLPLYLLMIVLN